MSSETASQPRPVSCKPGRGFFISIAVFLITGISLCFSRNSRLCPRCPSVPACCLRGPPGSPQHLDRGVLNCSENPAVSESGSDVSFPFNMSCKFFLRAGHHVLSQKPSVTWGGVEEGEALYSPSSRSQSFGESGPLFCGPHTCLSVRPLAVGQSGKRALGLGVRPPGRPGPDKSPAHPALVNSSPRGQAMEGSTVLWPISKHFPFLSFCQKHEGIFLHYSW